MDQAPSRETSGAPVVEAAGSPDFTQGIRLLARLARLAERACRESGISLPQYRLLVTISGESQRAGELAQQVGVSRPTLTSLVDGLEQQGLLRRVPVPSDRRGIQLELTDAGRDATIRAEAVLTRCFRQLVDRDVVTTVEPVIASLGAALDRTGVLASAG